MKSSRRGAVGQRVIVSSMVVGSISTRGNKLLFMNLFPRVEIERDSV